MRSLAPHAVVEGCASHGELTRWEHPESGEPSSMVPTLRAVTWNLWNVQHNWPARRDTIVELLNRYKPDVRPISFSLHTYHSKNTKF